MTPTEILRETLVQPYSLSEAVNACHTEALSRLESGELDTDEEVAYTNAIDRLQAAHQWFEASLFRHELQNS